MRPLRESGFEWDEFVAAVKYTTVAVVVLGTTVAVVANG